MMASKELPLHSSIAPELCAVDESTKVLAWQVFSLASTFR
jgi:hypothetical protein